MLKHLAITAVTATLLASFSAGYLFATTSLNSSRSNIYRTTDGKTVVPYSYTFNIAFPEPTTTAADRQAIVKEVCSQLVQDITPK